MVGFEPTYRLPDKRISSAPRYDHFDTSPCQKASYDRIILNAIRSVNRSDMERYWSDIHKNEAATISQSAYYIEPSSLSQKEAITFRVRPVMTTSIRLRSRYIIATFKMVSKKDLALHYVCSFLALEVLDYGKTEGDGGAHCLARDYVSACDDFGFLVKISTLFGHNVPYTGV